MKWLRRLFSVAVMIGLVWVGVLFSRANSTPVDIDLLLRQVPAVPVWLGLVVSVAVGAALAFLLSGFELVKRGLIARRYRKRIDSLESEVHQLRTLPLSDTAGGDVRPPPHAAEGEAEPSNAAPGDAAGAP
jgi:uncharacterized integral membrane protein